MITPMKPLIALLTDFGEKDGFVGVMKGIIHTIAPQPTIVDISHQISPQNIPEAQWVLKNAIPFYPPHTVFVTVVDPKVGDSQQKPILLYWQSKNLFFIGPDNGLFSPIFEQADHTLRIYRIENNALFTPALFPDQSLTISHTFHGRDIYAPVAAHLAVAIENGQVEDFLSSVGTQTGDVIKLATNQPQQQFFEEKTLLTGQIDYIDHFGNLITNIPNHWVTPNTALEIQLIHHKWESQHLRSYAEGEEEKEVFLVPSSCGCLELCLYGQSAKKKLNAQLKDIITLTLDNKES